MLSNPQVLACELILLGNIRWESYNSITILHILTQSIAFKTWFSLDILMHLAPDPGLYYTIYAKYPYTSDIIATKLTLQFWPVKLWVQAIDKDELRQMMHSKVIAKLAYSVCSSQWQILIHKIYVTAPTLRKKVCNVKTCLCQDVMFYAKL